MSNLKKKKKKKIGFIIDCRIPILWISWVVSKHEGAIVAMMVW